MLEKKNKKGLRGKDANDGMRKGCCAVFKNGTRLEKGRKRGKRHQKKTSKREEEENAVGM